MPKISVITAVYNSRAYLDEAVQSILSQTFTDFEFILIDDGSTDDSLTLCKHYAAKDKRITLISRPNKGLTKTLNEGLARASGEMIARMDSDDVALPTRFAEQVAYLDAHPECVCLGSRVELIDPYNTPLKISDQPLDHDAIDADLLRGIGWAIVHPVAMMRAMALKQIGGYNEEFRTSQDLELWLRLAEVGKLANLEKPLLQYRQHLESANFAKAEQQKQLKLKIMSAAYARRGLPLPGADFFPPPPLSDAIESRLRWGWTALRAHRPAAARKHAWANLKARPTHGQSWRLLACALRGR